LLSSFIIIIFGGLLAAFGPQEPIGVTASYVVYTLGRFLIAVGTRGINVTGFVLGKNRKKAIKLRKLIYSLFFLASIRNSRTK
jgi:hypothetical protein